MYLANDARLEFSQRIVIEILNEKLNLKNYESIDLVVLLSIMKHH